MDFLTKIWNDIKSWFQDVEDGTKKVADFANDLVNKLKAFQDSPGVQSVENVIIQAAETYCPAIIPLVSAVKLELPNLFKLIGNIDTAANETLEQQAEAFAKYLIDVKNQNPTVFAGKLATLSSGVQTLMNESLGQTSDPAHVIVASQVVHQQ